ncbi:Viral (Superfamily 1) RNA helicase [Burkholderia pseudomallei]|nr:Viral (Superfamily 1) RNA helicase [Burkholderia pseudomallei]CAJ6619474.1 Viral (Superfamily 1) RNA helicase [Burkholderia pseudomallei]
MDKTVILAVAGSGKTTRIVQEIDAQRRSLILTYTEQNLRNLRQKIIGMHGHMPPNVSVMTYFTFLYSFCFRPIAGLTIKTRGINFDDAPPRGRFKQTQQEYYIDASGRLYAGRAAKWLSQDGYLDELRIRVERFFDVVCIDEVQDFAGNDFNLLLRLAEASVAMLLVGDFRQHTYDTSRDGTTRSTLYDDFDRYVQHFRDAGVTVDIDTLGKSRRCSPAVCGFISDKLGIPMQTSSTREAQVTLVDTQAHADELRSRADIVKLFYNQHYKYGCHSQNWGASKGEDHYDEVCIILNKTTLERYTKGQLNRLPPATLNKLYVALSRSRGNVYLIPHTFFD